MSKKQPARTKQRAATSGDAVIGLKIRTARMQAHMSQDELGKKLGVSFQQIQKYEKGVNRVSAVRLPQIAKAVDQPVSYFLDGADTKPTARTSAVTEFIATREGNQLLEAAMALPSALQQSLIDLARSMARSRSA